MFKKTIIKYLLLFLMIFTFLSCRDSVTECGCSSSDGPYIQPDRFYFGRAIPIFLDNGKNFFGVNGLTECNISDCDSIVLACTIVNADPNNIPKISAKVRSLVEGDTKNYKLVWNKPVKYFVLSNPDSDRPMIVFQLISFLKAIVVYETEETVKGDGIKISPKGEQLVAEITFNCERYIAYLDIKPE